MVSFPRPTAMEVEEQWKAPFLLRANERRSSSSSEDAGGGLDGRRRRSAEDVSFRAQEGNGEKRGDEEHSRSVSFAQADDEAVKSLLESKAKPVRQQALLTRPQHNQEVHISVAPSSTDVDIPDTDNQVGSTCDWNVLKAIVYGGLAEAIISRGVVSSAAGAQASTLNIVALGSAFLTAGLFLIFHNLLEMRYEEYELIDPQNEEITNYGRSLGKRRHFKLHATVALLSYIIFGMLPPVVYGFSFRNSDNMEYKLIAVHATTLPCIALLALAKAHVKRPPKPYIKFLVIYIILAVSAAGFAYAVGICIKKFLENLHALDPNALVSPPPLEFPKSVWAIFLAML